MGELVLSSVLQSAATSVYSAYADAKGNRVTVDFSDARSSLLSQIDSMRTWCESITLLSLLRDRQLRDSFIQLDLQVGLAKPGESAPAQETFSVDDVYARRGHAAILGRPGAGKTTSLQRIAQSAIASWDNGGGVPILVRLRDLGKKETLARHVLDTLGVVVRAPTHMTDESRATWERRVLIHYLDKISATVMVDGLDEAPSNVRASVELDLREIALYPGDYRLFVTCRTAEYSSPLPNVQRYTILPLSSHQVREFAVRWLGEDAETFIDAVARNPYAGAEVVPLTLAHLCAIYEREGDLPERPIEVYEQIVSLLIEEWDRQRGIVRTSRYADFSWRKKERFLQAVAYHLAINGSRGSFRKPDLEDVYTAVAAEFHLPSDDSAEVIREIESHTGLIQEVGRGQFDFVHLVIHEYLTAMHAHRRADAVPHLMPAFPNEMALVVAYSATPTTHLEIALGEALSKYANTDGAFLIAFLARLSVERPTWQPSARLGWIVLGFLDLISRYFRELDANDELRIPDDALKVLRDAEVLASIRLAVNQAELVEEPFALRLIPNQVSDVPEELRRFLGKRNESGVGLIKSERVLADVVRFKS